MIDYNKQIEAIIEQALTEKTFSLEIIGKIKELRDAHIEVVQKLEASEADREGWRNKYSDVSAENVRLEAKVLEIEKREKDLAEREENQKLLQWERDSSIERRNEIKELVMMVFRNPIFKSHASGSLPVYDERNGYMSHGSTSEVKETTVE